MQKGDSSQLDVLLFCHFMKAESSSAWPGLLQDKCIYQFHAAHLYISIISIATALESTVCIYRALDLKQQKMEVT